MQTMRIYEVRISKDALHDMQELRTFLKGLMSEEGAIRYANTMRNEIKSLSVYADCLSRTNSKTLLLIHPNARRMVSHNRRWIYVYHIEGNVVIVDRIIPTKMKKG